MMIPTMARATEEMLLMVPNAVREAAYGLGIPQVADHAFHHLAHRVGRRDHRMHAGLRPRRRRNRAAAVYRVRQPVLELETRISPPRLCRCRFTLTPSRPIDEWHQQAWAGALILIVMIVAAVAAVRIVTSRGDAARERK